MMVLFFFFIDSKSLVWFETGFYPHAVCSKSQTGYLLTKKNPNRDILLTLTKPVKLVKTYVKTDIFCIQTLVNSNYYQCNVFKFELFTTSSPCCKSFTGGINVPWH